MAYDGDHVDGCHLHFLLETIVSAALSLVPGFALAEPHMSARLSTAIM